MPYLVAADLPTAPAGERFRALLGRPASCNCRAAQRHGGAAGVRPPASRRSTSRARHDRPMGLPDLGVITVDRSASSSASSPRQRLPVLADAIRDMARR